MSPSERHLGPGFIPPSSSFHHLLFRDRQIANFFLKAIAVLRDLTADKFEITMIKVAVRHIPMMKCTSMVLDHQTKHAGLPDCFIRGTAGCGSDFVVSGFIISPFG